MRYTYLYLICCVLTAAVPFVPWDRASGSHSEDFPGWPSHLEGSALKPQPLSDREKEFLRGFPGRMAKFTDGRRMILIRWVTRETRMLHPAADCFRGTGYRVTAMPVRRNPDGRLWARFHATRDGERVIVSERIYDESSASWTDVSSWYWAALLGTTKGPWWAITLVENQAEIIDSASD